MRNLTENAKKFLAMEPFKYGRISGYTFYECPIYGDENFVKAITPDGKLVSTGNYEYDREELTYWIARRAAK